MVTPQEPLTRVLHLQEPIVCWITTTENYENKSKCITLVMMNKKMTWEWAEGTESETQRERTMLICNEALSVTKNKTGTLLPPLSLRWLDEGGYIDKANSFLALSPSEEGEMTGLRNRAADMDSGEVLGVSTGSCQRSERWVILGHISCLVGQMCSLWSYHPWVEAHAGCHRSCDRSDALWVITYLIMACGKILAWLNVFFLIIVTNLS